MLDLPATDFRLLQLYWSEEPWGPWRDNVHAALIAAETRRPHVQNPRSVKWEDFVLRAPEQRRRSNLSGLLAFFRTVAKPVRKG